MKVLVCGATGYVGSGISDALRQKGHSVVGLAQSASAAETLRARGDGVALGDIERPTGLADLAQDADGIVYAIELHNPHALDVEPKAVRELLGGLQRSSKTPKPFVLTSGSWVYGDTGGRVVDETAPLHVPKVVAARPILEQLLQDAVASGVRSVIIRPGDVYGHNGGLPALFTSSVAETGAATYVGDGHYHWPVVHIDDLAQLFVLALESAQPGEVFNGNDETRFTVLEMAQAASRGAGAGGKTVSMPVEKARQKFGDLVDALIIDLSITSAKARRVLGWSTRTATILDDLEHGSYALAATKS